MRTILSLLVGLLGIFALRCPQVEADDGAAEQLFVRRIHPLLTAKCLACHGQDEQNIAGGLDLRTRAGLLNGGDSREPLIVVGSPDKSPLVKAVLRQDQTWSPMPPKEAEKLTAEQVRWIQEWIAQGAPWPDEARRQEIASTHADRWAKEDGSSVITSGGLSDEWSNRKYQLQGLWAYQPVKKPNLKKRTQNDLSDHPIDILIADKMPDGIDMAPAADARTFIRRASFDLTGLPPDPREIDAFERDFASSPEKAIHSLIDRLLASPHYGERMAQHWLDVTRYADSSGLANDYERGNAWRYRDYVVRSFNSDKPYDQFVREQIAGDEIDPNDAEKIIATGFLRMGPWELTGMEVEKVARQRFLDDVVNSVGETFLAHSLQCARCHDHKFDPIPTRDYYSIQAVFATTQISERAAPFLPFENTAGFEERAYLELRKAEHEATLAQLDNVLLMNAKQWYQDNGREMTKWNAAVESIRRQAVSDNQKGNSRRTYSDVFTRARRAMTEQGVPESEFPPKFVGFTPEQFGRERVARKGLERLKWEFDRYEPFALAVYSGRTREYKTVFAPLRMPENRLTQGELEVTCIHAGGDPFSEGPIVTPGVLSVLPGFQTGIIPDSIEGRRKAFAEWVANPHNPLTTRSIVNRIWMWHFGRPIAGNPNNFGSTGAKPTHPELLDWLAATFVEQRWSFQEMHRLIMTSEAYRRSCLHPNWKMLHEQDPLDSSYAVFKPRRLSAEELRDAMLSVSGELNPVLGGIPVRPEINLEAALQPRQVMGTFASAWVPNPKPEQRHRRSLYTLKLRGLGDPAMEVFNTPAPDFSCERREVSTVTPQVFSLFNSQASYSRSLSLAARVLRETSNDEEAIQRCITLVYGRPPRSEEIAACITHWQQLEKQLSITKPIISKPPIEVLREAVEENTGEKFSFIEKLHAYADFVPDLQSSDCDTRTRSLAEICLVLFNTNEFSYVY